MIFNVFSPLFSHPVLVSSIVRTLLCFSTPFCLCVHLMWCWEFSCSSAMHSTTECGPISLKLQNLRNMSVKSCGHEIISWMKASAPCYKRVDTIDWLQSRTEGMPRTHAHPLSHLIFIRSPPFLLHVLHPFPLCFAFTISHNEMRPPLQHDVTCLCSCFVFRHVSVQWQPHHVVLTNTANSTLLCSWLYWTIMCKIYTYFHQWIWTASQCHCTYTRRHPTLWHSYIKL